MVSEQNVLGKQKQQENNTKLKITYSPDKQNWLNVIRDNPNVIVLEIDSRQSNPDFLYDQDFYATLDKAKNLLFVGVAINKVITSDNEESITAKLKTVNNALIIQCGLLSGTKVYVKEYNKEILVIDKEGLELPLIVEALKSEWIRKFDNESSDKISLAKTIFKIITALKEGDNGNSLIENAADKDDAQLLHALFEDRNILHNFLLKEDSSPDEIKMLLSERKSSTYLGNKYGRLELLSKFIESEQYSIYAFLQAEGLRIEEMECSKLIKSLDTHQQDKLQKEIEKYFVPIEDAHIMFLLSKSEAASRRQIDNQNDFKKKIEDWYKKLDEIPEISSVLRVIATPNSSLEKIVFDFTKKSVVGTCIGCLHTVAGVTDYTQGRINLGAKIDSKVENNQIDEVLGVLAHELTHFAMHRVYENEYNPYSKPDHSSCKNFKEITEEIIEKLIKGNQSIEELIKIAKIEDVQKLKDLKKDIDMLINKGINLDELNPSRIQEVINRQDKIKNTANIDGTIRAVFTNYDNPNHWCSELIVRIPHMLAKYGQKNGKILLNDQVKKLYDYYLEMVIPRCKTFEKESNLIQPRNNIELLNLYLGVIHCIEKLSIEFKTHTKINDFLSQGQQERNYKNFLLIKTKGIWLGSCNIYQALQSKENLAYSPKLNKSLFLRIDQIKASIFDIFKSDAIDLLVIIFPEGIDKKQTDYALKKFQETFSEKPNKKIVFLIQEIDALAFEECLKAVRLSENRVFGLQNIECTLDDLSVTGKLAKKKVTFLGKEKKLNECEWPKNKINIETLEDLINKKPVVVGSEPIRFSSLRVSYSKLNKELQKNNLVDALTKDEKSLFLISGIAQEGNDITNELTKLLGVDQENDKTEKIQTSIKKKRIHLEAEQKKDINFKKFKQLCYDNSDQRVYWINLENNQFIWKQLYNPIYLDRSFQQVVIKKKIKDELVKTTLSDSFSFSGIKDKETLMILLEIDKEQEKQQFLNNENIKIENLIENKDAESVSQEKRLQDPDKCTHWLKVEKTDDDHQQLIWNRSHGSLKMLRQYVDENNIKPSFLDETKFSKQKNKVVIIADKPGMGKSTTLTRLSEQKLETNWVICINLKDCQDAISCLPTSQMKMSDDDVVKFLLKCDNIGLNTPLARNLFLHYITLKPESNQSFSMSLFDDGNIGKSLPIMLLFDGYDEIKGKDHKIVKKNQKKVINLLKYLKDKTEASLWITTRIHGKEKLEDELSVFATKLEEFLEGKQQDFLERFWKARLSLTLTEDKLKVNKFKQYTKTLLEKTNTVLGEKMSSLMGIPLQLRLIGEYFRENFENFVENNSVKPKDISNFNLLDLYQHFIKEKYEIYLQEKAGLSSGFNEVSKNWFCEKLTKLHQRLAFYELFPSKVKEFLNIKPPFQVSNEGELMVNDTDKQMQELYNVGLLQHVMGKFKFIHDTFAEYFVGDLLSHWVRKPIEKQHPNILEALQDLLLQEILMEPTHQVIRSFINSQLEKEPLPKTTLELYGKKINGLWNAEKKNLFGENKVTIIHIGAIEGNEKLIWFLLKSLKRYHETRKDIINTRSNAGKTLLHSAAESNQWNVVKWLIDKECVDYVTAEKYDSKTLLYRVTKKDKQDIVKSLLYKKILEKIVEQYRGDFRKSIEELLESLIHCSVYDEERAITNISKVAKVSPETATQAIENLKLPLTECSPHTQGIAIKVIGNIAIARPEIATQAIEILKLPLTEGSPYTEGIAIKAIGKIAEARPEIATQAIENLKLPLTKGSPHTQGIAIKVIGNIAIARPEVKTQAIEILKLPLTEGSPHTQGIAIKVIGNIAIARPEVKTQAIEAIKLNLSNRCFYTQELAKNTLARIETPVSNNNNN